MSKTEAKTRKEIIDVELLLAGWDVKDPNAVTEELDIPWQVQEEIDPKSAYAGHQFSDYALLKGGKPIAVIEAKKTSKDAKVGKEQALQYSQNLKKLNGGDYPFIFMSNGHELLLVF